MLTASGSHKREEKIYLKETLARGSDQTPERHSTTPTIKSYKRLYEQNHPFKHNPKVQK